MSGFWLHIVDDVRTEIMESKEYIYMPNLNPQGQI